MCSFPSHVRGYLPVSLSLALLWAECMFLTLAFGFNSAIYIGSVLLDMPWIWAYEHMAELSLCSAFFLGEEAPRSCKSKENEGGMQKPWNQHTIWVKSTWHWPNPSQSTNTCLFVCLVTKSCVILLLPNGLFFFCYPTLCPWDFPARILEMGCQFLLQGIFLTQESKPHLLHWQADSLLLSH